MTNEQTDILIEQVLTDPGAESRWREFERAADSDAGLWRRLAELQRDQALLEQAVEAQVGVADAIELPPANVRHAPPALDFDEPDASPAVLARIGVWSGWAVAALVAVAWVIVGQTGAISGSAGPGPRLVQDQTPSSTGADGVQFVNHSPQQYWDGFIRTGKEDGSVLTELPTRTLIDSRQLPDGRIEVLYIRHVMQRGKVETLLQFDGGVDEHGKLPVVRYEPMGHGGA